MIRYIDTFYFTNNFDSNNTVQYEVDLGARYCPLNIQMSYLVNYHKERYRKTKDKQAKTIISRSIVNKISSSVDRFLIYDKAKSKWIDVPGV